MTEGAWIFLSHSHRDFEKVRVLRTELELRGHKPLVFFLKCLDDASEIDDLIAREIRARSWFVLCDSDNARESKWVKREREIIATLPTHSFVTVQLDAPLAEQIESLAPLLKRASVFPSYARADQARVAPIFGPSLFVAASSRALYRRTGRSQTQVTQESRSATSPRDSRASR